MKRNWAETGVNTRDERFTNAGDKLLFEERIWQIFP